MSERLPGIRPRPNVWRQLDSSARRSFPATTTALLLLLTAAPMGLPGQAELQMAVALGCVYFWSVYRPASMPPAAVFGLGLLADLLDYAPVGVGVVSLLLLHGFAVRLRRFLVRQGFVVVWLAFVVLGTLIAALQWLLTCLLTFQLLPPAPALFQAMLGAGVYPLLAVLMIRAHQTLAEPDPA